jgi:4-hydroxy-tetrahydrodipicolinate reductase
MGGDRVITLEFIANAGVQEEYDEVLVKGVPGIHEIIMGGVHGDVGTVAMTINTIPKTVGATSGFKLMSELPAPAAIP